MSRISSVIKGKNKIKREIRDRKMNELARLKSYSELNANIIMLLKRIDIILEDKDVDGVIIEINSSRLNEFSKMLIQSKDLDGYEIRQVEDCANKFFIKRKYISI